MPTAWYPRQGGRLPGTARRSILRKLFVLGRFLFRSGHAAFAPFLSYMGNFMVVSEAYASQNSLLDTECGTGPYRLVDIEMNTECNMTRFDDYWRGPASIKNAKVKVITEGTTAVTAFEAGELDFMFCFNVSVFAPLNENDKKIYSEEFIVIGR